MRMVSAPFFALSSESLSCQRHDDNDTDDDDDDDTDDDDRGGGDVYFYMKEMIIATIFPPKIMKVLWCSIKLTIAQV